MIPGGEGEDQQSDEDEGLREGVRLSRRVQAGIKVGHAQKTDRSCQREKASRAEEEPHQDQLYRSHVS